LSGDIVSYAIEDGANWEIGFGAYSSSGPTLTRSTILASSNGGAAISATSAALVFVTPLAADLAPVPWAIAGLLPTAISGSATTAAMTVSAGSATDASGEVTLAAAAPMSWAVANGNAANGCADGTTLGNSKTYHMYLCEGASGQCLYASQSFGMAASSAPSGYQSYVRRIFSFITTSAGAPNLAACDEWTGGSYLAYLSAPVNDVNAPLSASRTLYTVSVPSGAPMRWLGDLVLSGSTACSGILTSPDEPDTAPTSGTPGSMAGDIGMNTSSLAYAQAPFREPHTNAAAQLGFRSTTSYGSVGLTTRAYGDARRS
jgi:hypothetical protein